MGVELTLFTVELQVLKAETYGKDAVVTRVLYSDEEYALA